MSEQEGKGFRIIDRRGISDAEREKEKPAPPPPPSPAPPRDPGNKAESGSVEGKKRPEAPGPRVGGPSFLDLVMTLQMGAMANLGLLQSGEGRRSPVNLPAAKDSIDLLEILQAKTKGNLSGEEEDVLREGLYHLRMAYVAAVNAGQKGGGGQQR